MLKHVIFQIYKYVLLVECEQQDYKILQQYLLQNNTTRKNDTRMEIQDFHLFSDDGLR